MPALSMRELAFCMGPRGPIEVLVEVSSLARERARDRIGIDLAASSIVDFLPTELVRDGLRLWRRKTDGGALLIRESGGSVWSSLVVVTALSQHQVACPPQVRPYQRAAIPDWVSDVDLDHGLARGRVLSAVSMLPGCPISDIAEHAGVSLAHAGTYLGDLRDFGLVAKHVRKRHGTVWKVRSAAKNLVAGLSELESTDAPVDKLRAELAAEVVRRKSAEAHVDALKSKVSKLKDKLTRALTMITELRGEGGGDDG